MSFTLTYMPVNDIPSFTGGADITIDEDNSFLNNWATDIYAGSNYELDQTFTFIFSEFDTDLFSVQPAINPESGELSFSAI